MGKALRTIGVFGAGAAMMYAFDPDRGRRRRALLRDKISSTLTDFRNEAEKASRDLSNRSHGLAAGLRTMMAGEEAGDGRLVARIRSKIGRVVSHPHAITVRAEQGGVTLEGPVLQDEADRLLSAVSSVHGVKQVHNRLSVHRNAGEVPGLQGGSPRHERPEFLQTHWTPALRLFAGGAGAALMFYGMGRRKLSGTAGALAGAALLARAAANTELQRIIGVGGGRRAVDIQKTIHLHAPVEEVFAFWSNYRNFPRFMSHLKEVRDLGNGRSHWIAEGPAGVAATWDAEVTELVPNRLVGWKSTPGSGIENAGVVRFDSNSDGTTRVTIRMSYNPPAGVVGHFVASLFGANPKREMDDDLVRLKSLIEFGKTRAHGETVRRDQLSGAGTA